MRRPERLIVLPQTITVTREGKQLENALEARPFPNMRDERDEPGTVETGTSRLDTVRRYGQRTEPHPVPVYRGVPVIRISREDHGFYPQPPKNFDVIRATKTAMSPAVAEAFIQALAEDPTHPFVRSHILPGMDLNGSDSWLTIGGPALAVPLTRLPLEDARSRQAKDYVAPEPEGEEVLLRVQVENAMGLASEDFIAAARRHPSLGEHSILLGHVELESLDPISHRLDNDSLDGNEVPMFKLAYDDETVGFYWTADKAQEALEEALLDGSRYRSTGLLHTGPYSNFRGRYTVEGCLVLDGKEVRRSVSTELIEATATIRATVATVDPAQRRLHAGWMLVWQTDDWHRNKQHVRQYLNDDGEVVAERRSHMDF
jgi:hypothetical protein